MIAAMVTHRTVFGDLKVYAGWPANHGAWQRGDEFLVGFMRGRFKRGGMHNIVEPFEKVLARSLNGGETWTVEQPDADFVAASTETAPAFDLSQSIMRCCGIYDHGGETCTHLGGFYISNDFGRTWAGAYDFGLTPEPVGSYKPFGTMRTSVLPDKRLVFVTYGVAGFDDYIECLWHDGARFHRRAMVVNDDQRAVMPSVAVLSNRLCLAARRRQRSRKCWIDLFVSDDQGFTWDHASRVAETGGHNGNPPALAAIGDRLFCAYADRTKKCLFLSESRDRGLTWTPHVVRQGSNADIGYPQLFRRSDGRLVCVYYWSDEGEAQHIEASVIETEWLS